jgi:4'-phosphopantetheinyl transferase
MVDLGAGAASSRRQLARWALQIALGRHLGRPPERIEIVPGPLGRPELAGPGPSFSTARSGRRGLIAVSDAGPVGVDLERIAATPELEAIVARRFAPGERAAILALAEPARTRAFFTAWTAKEAWLKATGAGLTIPTDRVVVGLDGPPRFLAVPRGAAHDWALVSRAVGCDLLAAVVTRGPHHVPAFAELALPAPPKPDT